MADEEKANFHYDAHIKLKLSDFIPQPEPERQEYTHYSNIKLSDMNLHTRMDDIGVPYDVETDISQNISFDPIRIDTPPDFPCIGEFPDIKIESNPIPEVIHIDQQPNFAPVNFSPSYNFQPINFSPIDFGLPFEEMNHEIEQIVEMIDLTPMSVEYKVKNNENIHKSFVFIDFFQEIVYNSHFTKLNTNLSKAILEIVKTSKKQPEIPEDIINQAFAEGENARKTEYQSWDSRTTAESTKSTNDVGSSDPVNKE